MSGVIIAAIVFTLALVSHLLVSQFLRSTKPEPVLVGFMGGAAVAYIGVYLSDPLNALRVVPRSADFLAGLATFGFLALGYVEFWSLIERSFSLRILIDLAASDSALTAEQIAGAYADGRGLGWMMEKRIEDLVGSGMLAADGSRYHLSPRGRTVGTLFRLFQRALGVL